jgi:hypothetical protein
VRAQALVSKACQIENKQPGHGHLSSKRVLDWEIERPGPSGLFPARTYLETVSVARKTRDSNWARIGNKFGRAQAALSQLDSCWKRDARKQNCLFPARADLETHAFLFVDAVSESVRIGNMRARELASHFATRFPSANPTSVAKLPVSHLF